MVKVEDPALELPPNADAEELSPPLPLSHGDDDDDDDEETDSDGDDDDDGAAGAGDAPPLKKGPWTPDEDKRLREYVEAHGEGNWNQVQRNAGLNRCGKSCRLRWANHLRPDLKKGPFDEQEVEKIIRLHMEWGNKWAKMAACLPGRTDNEIKNYWNTRLKRHQRAGLPIYPEYLVSRVSDQDMKCHTPDESRGKKRPYEFSQEKAIDINELMVFKHLDYDKDPVFPDTLKHHAFTGYIASDYNGSHSCVQIPDETEKTFCSTGFNYLLTKNQSAPHGSAIANGHPIFDGNPSTSGTIQRSMKTELPSFQYSSNGLSNGWINQCPSASPIEQHIDSFIQSPESISSQNTGLLGGIIRDGLDDPIKSEIFSGMSIPPLSYNQVSQLNAYPMRQSSSVLGDCEPEGCPFVETEASKSPSSSDALFTLSECYPETRFSDTGMPDTSLEASVFNENLLHFKDQPVLFPSGPLFDMDSCEEAKLSTAASLELDSSAWKSMPGAFHMPDFPGP